MTEPNHTDTHALGATGELAEYVGRVERLSSEEAEIKEQIKEVKAEIKARGYDMPAFNAVLARRKRDRDDVENQDAMIELYEGTIAGSGTS